MRFVLWGSTSEKYRSHYAKPDFVSVVQDGSVTEEELQALRSGAVVEFVSDSRWSSIDAAMAELPKMWAVWQQQILTDTPLQRYGTYWDDQSGWKEVQK